MSVQTIALETLWGGVFAGSLAIRLTAPRRFLVASFMVGAAGRLACDSLIASNVSKALSTGIGAAVVVVLAMSTFQSREAWPVVIISGVLPLGAADSMVRGMWHLMMLPSLEGEAHVQAVKTLNTDTSDVVLTFAAIAAGASLGLVLMRLIRREDVFETD